MSRVENIFKDIKKIPNKKNIDYNVDIENLSYKEIGSYMLELREYCKSLEYSNIRNS